MRNLKTLTLLALVLIISSCANTVKFPVSKVAPAADIVGYKNLDKNGNYKISIVAKNLASPDRIDPSKSVYVVWVALENNEVRKIGQLSNKNAKTTGLKALIPFNFIEVFITLEGPDNVTYPTGIEISRVRFK